MGKLERMPFANSGYVHRKKRYESGNGGGVNYGKI